MTGLSIPAGCLLSSSSLPPSSALVALMLSKYLNMRGPNLAGSVLYTNEDSRPAYKRRLLYFGVGLPKIEEQSFLT